MDRYVGKMLDNRYEILEPIGVGGMAVVYKARCHRLNRFVAIKILRDELAQDEDLRRRFHDESQAVAMLSHPNIVAVYDVSKSSELDYIVMELIDGITLKQYMQKKGDKLSWREALHFISQIVRALSHAHSRGIIHRDIKPHNMMILRDGTLKVSDFGIARLTNSSQATLAQEALGSVHYISPEQAKGSYIDARSDLYSAGVVLYEMITGRLPFEGATLVSVAIQHINSIPLSPRDIDPEVPEALEVITMKAMAPDLPKRYISADAMLSDLEEFRKNPNITFTINPEDLMGQAEDEPTQILGANTPAMARMASKPKESQGEPTNPRSATKRTKAEKQREEELYDDDDEYEYYDEPSGWRRVLPGVVAVLAILIFIGGIGYFLWSSFFQELLFPENQEVSVPSIVGYTVEEAEALAGVTEYRFVIEVEDTQYSTAFPEGQIIEQSPKSTQEVMPGSTITVVVSGGEEIDLIPNVVNEEYRIATSTLENLGLSILVVEDYDDVVASGYVISQSPEADTAYEEGDQVTIVVSLGAEVENVTTISFINMTLEAAEQLVEEMKLNLTSITEEYSDTVEEGFITYQSVPVGSTVPEGTSISLKVSLGPADGIEGEENSEGEENPSDVGTDGGDVEENDEDVDVDVEEPSTSTTTNIIKIEVVIPSEYAQEETVTAVLYVGDSIEWQEDVNPNWGPFYPLARGSGVQTISIYINGVLTESYTEDFGG